LFLVTPPKNGLGQTIPGHSIIFAKSAKKIPFRFAQTQEKEGGQTKNKIK